jgi:hypothetical protein
MDNKLIISPLALKELEESSEWYEERVAGLGGRFVEVIYNSLTLVSVNPKAYPKKKAQYREFVVDKFPYVIVFELVENENTIYVLHVFHTSRNPKFKYERK